MNTNVSKKVFVFSFLMGIWILMIFGWIANFWKKLSEMY